MSDSGALRWLGGTRAQAPVKAVGLVRAATAQLTCVLVDEPIETDRRVQKVIAEQSVPVVVLDIRAARSTRWYEIVDYLHASWLLLAGLSGWHRRLKGLTPHLRGSVHHPLFAGLRACFRHTVVAVRAARELRKLSDTHRPTSFYANDLTAGLTVALARLDTRTVRIYDAHELEIHRHRRTGWLRILIEHNHEERAVAAATEMRTVSRPIAETLGAMHSRDSRSWRVVVNDLFEHHEIPPAPADLPPALAYVGGGSRGRRFDRLEQAVERGFSVHTWLLKAEDYARFRSAEWQRGSRHYEPELVALVASRRTLMWCCLEIGSLSYRLALPNKFFQALAMCMPIVASPGSYLAELVEWHGIGIVDDGGRLEDLAARAQSDEYVTWVNNIVALRSRLRRGEVAL